jgi:hypothetical protein
MEEKNKFEEDHMILKRLVLAQILGLAFLVCLSSFDAHAIGLGAYGRYGTGSETWKYDQYLGSFSKDTPSYGFGFLLDSTVARDSLFNYQFNLGYQQEEVKPFVGGLKLTGISMSHDFGFGVVRSQVLRFWLGPELKFSYVTGSSSTWDYNKFDFGIGPVLGVNFHLGPVVTLSLKGGYLFDFGAGRAECKGSRSSCGPNSDFTSNGGEPFINFAIIFRIGDNF